MMYVKVSKEMMKDRKGMMATKRMLSSIKDDAVGGLSNTAQNTLCTAGVVIVFTELFLDSLKAKWSDRLTINLINNTCMYLKDMYIKQRIINQT